MLSGISVLSMRRSEESLCGCISERAAGANAAVAAAAVMSTPLYRMGKDVQIHISDIQFSNDAHYGDGFVSPLDVDAIYG